MAKLLRTGQAGTLESNDLMITIYPEENDKGIIIELESIALQLFGRTIRQVIETTIAEQGIKNARVKAVDRGALDFTIKARTLVALQRSGVVLKEGSI